jgi:hypothetical protein
MTKKFFMFVAVIIVLTASSSGYDENFYLKSISKDHQTAVIGQKKSGQEWTVRQGDKIQNWNVIEITEHHVVLRSDPDEVTDLTMTIGLALPGIAVMPSVPVEDQE